MLFLPLPLRPILHIVAQGGGSMLVDLNKSEVPEASSVKPHGLATGTRTDLN